MKHLARARDLRWDSLEPGVRRFNSTTKATIMQHNPPSQPHSLEGMTELSGTIVRQKVNILGVNSQRSSRPLSLCMSNGGCALQLRCAFQLRFAFQLIRRRPNILLATRRCHCRVYYDSVKISVLDRQQISYEAQRRHCVDLYDWACLEIFCNKSLNACKARHKRVYYPLRTV